MNIVVLNRVNSNQKEDKTAHSRMYYDWSSVPILNSNNYYGSSVLQTLPLSYEAAKQIVCLVVQPIASSIGVLNPSSPSILVNEREVVWSMEVIGFGLSLPLSTNEHDMIRDCVHIYCEWLSALLPQPKNAVPLPLLKLPNQYSRKIFNQLLQIFIPRPGEASDQINRQAVLCHRVLRTIQLVVTQSTIIDEDTWDSLLLLLLTINDVLLAPPTIPNDIGDQLCDRVLSVLLEIWLHACAKSFPSPRMWKTLTELAQSWRHRTSLVTQWNRITLALTSRLLHELYGPNLPKPSNHEDLIPVPHELSGEVLAQTWYRLLNCIGNPVQLSRPNVISQTYKFLQFSIVNSQLSDPCQHPCLSSLPHTFLEAMKGVARLIDNFLGVHAANFLLQRAEGKVVQVTHRSLPCVLDGGIALISTTKARCNSLLHLFGAWLFEASLIDCENQFNSNKSVSESITLNLNVIDRSRASSVSVTSEASIQSNRPRSATVVEQCEHSFDILSSGGYESGRAEALGALCRIIGSKSTDEDILPQYLSRFYLVLNHGLKIKDDKFINEGIASILLHSVNLFRNNLDGVFILIPSFIDAIELILGTKDFKTRPNVNRVELRRASIQVLISILAVPLHFQSMPLKELTSHLCHDRNFSSGTSLLYIRQKLSPLLFSALQTETDSLNTHLLLGGLTSLIHDSAAFEQSEHTSIMFTGPPYSVALANHDTSSNLMSTISDNHSCHSTSSNSYPSISEITIDSHIDHDTSYSDKLSYNGPLTTFSNGSLHALVNSTLHMVSCKLLGNWKGDLNTSLAALELLSSLAKLRLADQSMPESRRVVRVLCEFISMQCSRPPPAHSKDLHSTIVAAYNCCASWLLAHSYLTMESESLNLVLQVVELGISGSKSIVTGKNGENFQIKQDKLLKPVSLRVRDAAEFLLTVLVELVGNFPSPIGADSVSSSLNENDLYQSWGQNLEIESTSNQRFRYFATSEGTILVGVLEQPPNCLPEPTVTILIRNQFGRQVWTSQIRHLARHKCGVTSYVANPGRPLPMNELRTEICNDAQYFPDSIERVRPCFADKILPSMETLITADDRVASELDKLGRLVDLSSSSSNEGVSERNKFECQTPFLCNEFQSARLFLSHIGCLSVDGLQGNSFRDNYLIRLDSSSKTFSEDLDILDKLGSRSSDTVFVFYVRSGQKDSREILSNTSSALGDTNFSEFLGTLGWPQENEPYESRSRSFPMQKNIDDPVLKSPNRNLNISDNGLTANRTIDHRLYCSTDVMFQHFSWTDGLSEVLFVIPNRRHSSNTPPEGSGSNVEFNLQDHPQNNMVGCSKEKVNQMVSDSKMFIVWLESFEDRNSFPIGEILMSLSSQETYEQNSINEEYLNDCFFLFIHAQQSGLYRISLQGPQSRVHFATPLVDGMIVARRVLGTLVRQTVMNMAKRRRLDHDSYHVPHIRRKLKISEMTLKYRTDCDIPSFYSSLFCSPDTTKLCQV